MYINCNTTYCTSSRLIISMAAAAAALHIHNVFQMKLEWKPIQMRIHTQYVLHRSSFVKIKEKKNRCAIRYETPFSTAKECERESYIWSSARAVELQTWVNPIPISDLFKSFVKFSTLLWSQNVVLNCLKKEVSIRLNKPFYRLTSGR